MRLLLPTLLLAACLVRSVYAESGTNLDWFKATPEPAVAPSPAKAASFSPMPGESISAFAVSPLAPTAVLVTYKEHARLNVWDPRSDSIGQSLDLPLGVQVSGIAVHPENPIVFLVLHMGKHWQIVRQAFPAARWAPTVLIDSKAPLGDLLLSTRKFTSALPARDFYASAEYRLYFSIDYANSYALQSVRENGGGYYTVSATPAAMKVLHTSAYLSALAAADTYVHAFQGSSSARPVAIHPENLELTYRDDHGCFHRLIHNKDNWAPVTPKVPGTLLLPATLACSGAGEYLPNGLGWAHWLPNQPGITVSSPYAATFNLAAEQVFLSQPHLTSDGHGLIGLSKGASGIELRYVPVNLPLAEVANAGDFVHSSQQLKLLMANDGLLTAGFGPQLYSLYDSELYEETADGVPKPYLVTTDIFFELYAAAYESMFTVSEDNSAIPAFWSMVTAADRALSAKGGTPDPLTTVFHTLVDLQAGHTANPEVARILAAQRGMSSISNEIYDFNGTRPRGFYNRSDTAATYFRAMRYLTTIQLSKTSQAEFSQLPAEVQSAAQSWIYSYLPFIAPARGALVWPEVALPQASYAHDPLDHLSVFPLSWGFYNEVFNRVVLHKLWPKPEWVWRNLPVGADLAAVLGNELAGRVLEPDLSRIANYRGQLTGLQNYYQAHKQTPELNDGLYQAWLQALAVQWAPTPAFPGSSKANALWSAKRLQTGLASWATLRHSTILVNDQASAEAGEGGDFFEMVQQRPPRGYVEPDPATFKAIAGLFDRALVSFDGIASGWTAPSAVGLRQGFRERLQQSRDAVLSFAAMADKEVAGQPLSDDEYASIQLPIAKVCTAK